MTAENEPTEGREEHDCPWQALPGHRLHGLDPLLLFAVIVADESVSFLIRSKLSTITPTNRLRAKKEPMNIQAIRTQPARSHLARVRAQESLPPPQQ